MPPRCPVMPPRCPRDAPAVAMPVRCPRVAPAVAMPPRCPRRGVAPELPPRCPRGAHALPPRFPRGVPGRPSRCLRDAPARPREAPAVARPPPWRMPPPWHCPCCGDALAVALPPPWRCHRRGDAHALPSRCHRDAPRCPRRGAAPAVALPLPCPLAPAVALPTRCPSMPRAAVAMPPQWRASSRALQRGIATPCTHTLESRAALSTRSLRSHSLRSLLFQSPERSSKCARISCSSCRQRRCVKGSFLSYLQLRRSSRTTTRKVQPVVASRLMKSR